MSTTLTQWHLDHLNFGILLNLLEEQLAQFHEGRTPNYDMILDIMYYMTHYSDAFHHPKEDLAFAFIRKRAPESGAEIDKLIRQHAELKQAGAALMRDLDDIVNGSTLLRERVETATKTYLTIFRRHMRLEETKILPLAADVLFPSDWLSIDEAVSRINDPVFGAHPEERYRNLRDQISREAKLGT